VQVLCGGVCLGRYLSRYPWSHISAYQRPVQLSIATNDSEATMGEFEIVCMYMDVNPSPFLDNLHVLDDSPLQSLGGSFSCLEQLGFQVPRHIGLRDPGDHRLRIVAPDLIPNTVYKIVVVLLSESVGNHTHDTLVQSTDHS
jgi:hypothetical protein